MIKSLRVAQKSLLKLLCLGSLIALLLSCGGSGNSEKFIGTWSDASASSQNDGAIRIGKFGENFIVKATVFDETDRRNREAMTASYNKEFDKLVVPGENGAGTDIIYNAVTNTIMAWGAEYKKLNCAILRNCKLQFLAPEDTSRFVVINNNNLIDYQGGYKQNFKSKLNWLNDCEYEMTITEVTNSNFPIQPGAVLNIKFEKIEKDIVYFISTFNGKSSKLRCRISN